LPTGAVGAIPRLSLSSSASVGPVKLRFGSFSPVSRTETRSLRFVSLNGPNCGYSWLSRCARIGVE
jgi:hypothetical protein